MATGSAVSPHLASKLFPNNEHYIEEAVKHGQARLSGEIVTPAPTQSVDLSVATDAEIQAHLDRITLYRQLSGRPAIFVYDPAAGHWLYLYTDAPGGSHETKEVTT